MGNLNGLPSGVELDYVVMQSKLEAQATAPHRFYKARTSC